MPPSTERSPRTAPTTPESAITAAADQLWHAAHTRKTCPPVRNLIGGADVEAAYRVQSQLTSRRVAAGARVVGRKIGLTSESVQRQLGVDQPDFGVLFDDMGYLGGDVVSMSRLIQPRAEAEIAFMLEADLADGPLNRERVRSAVAYLTAAIEVVDSRITDWDITFGDTVADNASSGLYVLGPERRSLADLDPATVEMRMLVDGEVVSTGHGSACVGDPLNALTWLARTAREFGDPLRAGQVVLSGALGPMHPLHAGAVVRAEVTGLGAVTATFSEEQQ